MLLFFFHSSSYLILCRLGNFLWWLLKEQIKVCQWSARLHQPQPIKHKYCSICTYHILQHPDSIQSITAEWQICISVFSQAVNRLIPVNYEACLCCKARPIGNIQYVVTVSSGVILLVISTGNLRQKYFWALINTNICLIMTIQFQ